MHEASPTTTLPDAPRASAASAQGDAAAPAGAPSVMSTMHADGSRRWLKPRLSLGRFLTARRIVAWALIAIFAVIPYLRMDGKPLVLLDLTTRRFIILGHAFLPTDTLLLALLVLGVFFAIFLLTALFGRVWCGWACPQTVYMEFVYRPLERFFRGAPGRPKKGWLQTSGVGTYLMYGAYFLASCYLAHTFLAYFVGIETLYQWVQQSPLRHPTPFLVMAAVTGLMMFDFAFFREQTCLVACPYGRFQSALLDRHSLIVSYDRARGEPRGKQATPRPDAPMPSASKGDVALPVMAFAGVAFAPSASGRTADCVDCGLCVTTCPTGIDIRNGLQMECIGCAQCIDACDAVMTKLKRPRGLIRYTSQGALMGEKFRMLRARVVIYPTVLTIVLALFVLALSKQAPAHISVQRGQGTTFYALPDGQVANPVRIKIINRREVIATYSFESLADGATVLSEQPSIVLAPGEATIASATLRADPALFRNGVLIVPVRVSDDQGYSKQVVYRMMGPGGSHVVTGSEREHARPPSPPQEQEAPR
jgi:polyferredoxin